MKRRLRIAGLLALPMTWLIGIYIFSLVMLLVTAFWITDPFTSKVKPGFTLRNFERASSSIPPTCRHRCGRWASRSR